VGYKFYFVDSDDKWFKARNRIDFTVIGPKAGPVEFDWQKVSPKAKLSIAIGTVKEIDGSYVFQRFLSPISVAEFIAPK